MNETPPKYIESKYVDELFSVLNHSMIRYVLIKNIADELPYALKNGKDIDILVHPKDQEAFSRLMLENHYVRTVHPVGEGNGWRFAYSLEPSEFWKRVDISDELYIDVNFRLCCHSFSEKTWIPLDRIINVDVWEHRRFDVDRQWWRMDDDTTLIYLIVRSVFDKQIFRMEYIREIEKLAGRLQQQEVKEKLSLIFFNFTTRLIELLRCKKYSEILHEYVTFIDY